LGACGKSAQIPLYTWLPDAMAGPTPVSALIHAATMVTAGIFMITRLNYLFDLAPDVQNIIAIIGAVTSLSLPLSHWFKLILKVCLLPFLN
jgi:NADH-quinone oxidoreductase subunit L